MDSRRHLCRPIRLAGRALFSGGRACVTLSPGTPGAGWRWAVGEGRFSLLLPSHRVALPRRSALEDPRGRADLCEHLLAALLIADIDDCDLRFGDGEAPILDGSAAPWLLAIRQSGVRGHRPVLASALHVSIHWKGQSMTWTSRPPRGITADGIAYARTFVRQREAIMLRASGTFPGARPGCAMVLDDEGTTALYGGRPRVPQEPLAHKLLDVLGDLAPWRARGRLAGRLHIDNPGHSTNEPAITAALAGGQLRLTS